MWRSIRPGLTLQVLAATGLALLAGCSSTAPSSTPLQGAGSVKTETRAVPEFAVVEVRHGVKLELTVGAAAKVELVAQENLLPVATTTVADGRLTVDTSRDYASADGITVRITAPTLEELVLAGGASGRAAGIQATDFRVRTDGIATLALSGTAESLTLNAKGGGQLDFADLTTTGASVDLAGGVKVTLTATQSVTGSAVGGVVLTVMGNPPTVDVSTTGGAVVTKG